MFYKITKEQAELIGKFDFGKNQKFDPFVGEQKDGSFLVSEKMYTLLKEHGALKRVDFKGKTTVTKQSLDFEVKSAINLDSKETSFRKINLEKEPDLIESKQNLNQLKNENTMKRMKPMRFIGICIFIILIIALTFSLFTETATGIDILIYIFSYLICGTALILLIRDK